MGTPAFQATPTRMPPPDQFRYDGFVIDADRSEVTCTYATATHAFAERFTFGPGGDWDDPAVRAAVHILFLLAGVSYYKTTAAPVIDLGDLPTTAAERAFLTGYYVHGLGEFAYRNGIDLRGLCVTGPDAVPAAPVRYEPGPGRPLIPFGGGIDSIVTVESLSGDHPGAALCVVHPPDERFAAIEDAAARHGAARRAHRARPSTPSCAARASRGSSTGTCRSPRSSRPPRSWPPSSKGATPSCCPTSGRPRRRRWCPTGRR